jgi:hypothetical protein
MSQNRGQVLEGPITIRGDLIVTGNVNKGALINQGNQNLALSATLIPLGQVPSQGQASGGTATPTQLTVTLQGFYDSILISWVAQNNLRFLDHYEIQVSSDQVNWYALRNDGVDWKGTLNAVTSCYTTSYSHQNLPFQGTAQRPTSITLYYRVRQVTVAAVQSSWSAVGSGIASPIPAGKIAASAVGSAQIAISAIQGSIIAAGAITSSKIAAQAVTNAKLAISAVTVSIIAANAITAPKIAASAVGSAAIAARSILNGKIALSAISTSLVAAGAIKNANIASSAITAIKIAGGTITANRIAVSAIQGSIIAAGAITNAKIGTSAITAAKIAAGAITTVKLLAGNVTATTIGASAIIASKISAGAVTTPKILAGNITATTIATSAITSAKIMAGAIIATKIGVSAVTAAAIAASAITAAKIAVSAITAAKLTLIGWSPSLTAGQLMNDASAWTLASGSAATFTTDSTGVMGVNVVQAAAQCWYKSLPAPYAAATSYKVIGAFVESASGNGTAFLGITFYDSNKTALTALAPGPSTAPGASTAPGSNAYWVAMNNVSPTSSWQVFTSKIDSVVKAAYGMPVSAKYISVSFILGYGISAGNQECQGVHLETAVDATLVVDGSISANAIAASAITAVKIAAGAVVAGKIATGAIVASNIAAASITGVQIAASTIGAANIQASAITAVKIAGRSITSAQIKVGGIIATSSIQARSITASLIQAKSIGASLIGSNSISTSMLTTNCIKTSLIAASAITAAKVNFNSAFISSIASKAININSGGYIQSSSFSSGSVGFKIQYNGNAEFNNVVNRGETEAAPMVNTSYHYLGNIFVNNGITPQYFFIKRSCILILRKAGSSGTVYLNLVDSSGGNPQLASSVGPESVDTIFMANPGYYYISCADSNGGYLVALGFSSYATTHAFSTTTDYGVAFAPYAG